MEEQRAAWGVQRFDLVQVHNLLNWDGHLETLKQWKDEGRIRYLGITTSNGRRHDEMEAELQSQPLDYVQFTSHLLAREADAGRMPVGADRGQDVAVTRP